MDILRFTDASTFGIIILLLTIIFAELGDTTSIFDVILGIQPTICSSLTNPRKQSIIDSSIIHPPAVNEQLHYEYTISTPNFPSNYPTNIQCISLIKAPNVNYTISLEVRQMFDIEPSKNCARDFVEITDGPYGFSRRIGRFCNLENPLKEVKSTGPFMWLRFRSDDNLSHNGFKIAYRFIRKTNEIPKSHYCYNQVIIPPGNSFKFQTTLFLTELKGYAQTQENSSIPLECVYDFHVDRGFKTFLVKEVFKKPNFPIPCSSNRLDIFYKGTFETDLEYSYKRNYLQICEESDFTHYLLKHTTRTTFRITIQDLNKINPMIFTITSVKIVTDNCPLGYESCSNAKDMCISKSLLCNNESNCPGKSDENCLNGELLPPGQELTTQSIADPDIRTSTAKSQEDTNKTHAIILGSIGFILLISMVLCLLLTIHSKNKDRETRRINAIDLPTSDDEKHMNKTLFYELLESSEPNVEALSTEKLSRKIYFDNHMLSQWPVNNTPNSSSHRINDCIQKPNGDIKSDYVIKATSTNIPKPKTDSCKAHSLNRIGKYLSVPYPVKNDINDKPVIPNKQNNHRRSYATTEPSEDLNSWNSHGFSKPSSTTINSDNHIKRASSLGSGLRKQFIKAANDQDLSGDIDWYCGPVIKASSNQNNCSEAPNAVFAKSPEHVPGCRSLPNFQNVVHQNDVYCTQPITSVKHHNTPSLDLPKCTVDSNDSSSGEETPPYSVHSHHNNRDSNKCPELRRHPRDPVPRYGFTYVCGHKRTNGNNFVEYIA